MKSLLFISLLLYGLSALSIPTLSQNLMVSGASKLALESALRVGKEGGNPVDVAVAYALTMSVTHPYFGSLGGGGFAMVNMNGQPLALDFRERAPAKTHKDYYTKGKKDSRHGGSAVGVPGIPMGLWDLHQKYGRLSWKRLFKEALYYSKKGFPVSSEWYTVTKKNKSTFWKEGAFHLLKNKKVPLPGDLLKQPGLYKTLKKLQLHGPKGFYTGEVAKDIRDSVVASGGDMVLKDLSSYKTNWRQPLETQFQGNKIFLMPPPSSGGLVIQTALSLVEKKQVYKKAFLGASELHHLAEIMSRSFRARALIGDPDFNKNPLDFILSDKYLDKLSKSIHPVYAKKLNPLKESKFQESDQTTHFVVLNKKGQAVAMTVTLNGNYGSGVISKKFGIALNNEMDDFTTQPGKPNMYGLIQGQANYVEAGKRPLSSMSPTLVTRGKKTVLAIGAPGGPRIINGVFQGLYRSLANGLNMEQAIYAPRLHHQFLPNITFYERGRFSPETLRALRKRGHKLKPIHGVAIVYGAKINDEGLLEGAADFRGEGFVGGL